MEILDLHRSGLSQRAIARRLGISRNTVKKYLDAPEEYLKNPPSYHRASILEPYYDAIKAWLEEDGYYTATWIYNRLVNQGYTGSYVSGVLTPLNTGQIQKFFLFSHYRGATLENHHLSLPQADAETGT